MAKMKHKHKVMISSMLARLAAAETLAAARSARAKKAAETRRRNAMARAAARAETAHIDAAGAAA